jgi:hypothetical protein
MTYTLAALAGLLAGLAIITAALWPLTRWPK